MSATTAFLSTLGLGALLIADELLRSERLARALHPARRLWLAHAAHVLLAQAAVLLFGWTRLYFSPASAPAAWELVLLACGWTAVHMAADLWLMQRRLLAELLKLASLIPLAWLLQLRHAEWTALAQGPILFLGQQVAIADFALKLALFFGFVWAGLAWRDRSLALGRLGMVAIFALAIGLGAGP